MSHQNPEHQSRSIVVCLHEVNHQICRLIQCWKPLWFQLVCREDPSITCCLFAIEPEESNILDSNHVQLWETCWREGEIVSVCEREGMDEGRRRRKGGGGTRRVCFSELVLNTGLIANKCLVLEQQAPLSSVAAVVGDLHIMLAIWIKKGHGVPQQSVCCCEERSTLLC